MSQSVAALEAYLRLIERQGATPAVVAQRRALLLRLQPRLEQGEHVAETFRSTVDDFLRECPLQDKVLALTCTREYYYFWLGDMKKVVEITARAGFTLYNLDIRMEASLEALLLRMRQQGFQRFPPSLEIYLGKLFEDGVAEAEIRQREPLLQALLYLLDGQPFSPGSYRMAVDAVLLHLDEPALKPAFLQLVREYFYYWQSFPASSQRGAVAQARGVAGPTA